MNKKNIFYIAVLAVLFSLTSGSCKKDSGISDHVFGFEFLSKIPGLWHGPVTSTTSAGSFADWYVDFRPVSEAQISQFSLLDTNTVNNMSFFIVRYNEQLKVAMRTEGCFRNSCCVTYEVMDSVSPSADYFCFSDFVKGRKRAFTEFTFYGDSMIMKVFTSKFNTADPVVLHTTWKTVLSGRENAAPATTVFSYPRPLMVKDFTNAFSGMTESIFFTFEADPYSSVTQPYVGSARINVSIDSTLVTDTTDQVFVLFTTKPLFEGGVYVPGNLKYISRYVYLSAATTHYTINSTHPGTYYLYSFIDKNHDYLYLSGDYMNSNFSNAFTVTDKQETTVNTHIDYLIP